MNECGWWEQVSAATDGELPDDEAAVATRHAERCPTCSDRLSTSTLGAGHLERAPRTVDTPPLSAAALTDHERRWLTSRWTRRLLLVAAAIIVIEAVPAYIGGHGLSAESHAARHLASWQIGFGVGLFVAAWMSRMSHAILALGTTFAVLTITATAIDVIGGHRGPLAESVHLVELIAVFLLWRMMPTHLLTRRHTGSSVQRSDRSSYRSVTKQDPGT